MSLASVTNKVNANVDVFHPIVQVWVMCAYDGPLVITLKNTGFSLKKTKFEEEGSKSNDLSCTMHARNVFGFA